MTKTRSGRLPAEALRERLSQAGDHLWQLAHGIDERPVIPDREAKSISHETTFADDIARLDDVSEQIAERFGTPAGTARCWPGRSSSRAPTHAGPVTPTPPRSPARSR